MAETQTTSLNRPWLAKMLIFFVVLVFFGLYGLYDATVSYPNRGLRYASYLEYQYLDAANSMHLLDARTVSIPDPVTERARLEVLDKTRATQLDPLRLEWLRALAVVNALKPQNTVIEKPDETYQALKAEWTGGGGSKAAPKPLASYDIWVQWIFVAVGLGGALYMLGLFLNVARQRFTWDAASQTLTLPSGEQLRPADIEDFDKRKWDKFLIFLKIKPSHPTLGGRELKLDLYRYAPLESWVLEMEQTVFPDRAAENTRAESAPVAPPSPEEGGAPA